MPAAPRRWAWKKRDERYRENELNHDHIYYIDSLLIAYLSFIHCLRLFQLDLCVTVEVVSNGIAFSKIKIAFHGHTRIK